jgi:hypothetical protein
MSIGALIFIALAVFAMIYVTQKNTFNLDERTAKIVKVAVWVVCMLVVIWEAQYMF